MSCARCQVGQGQSIRVKTLSQDAEAEAATVADLRTLYEVHGYEVTASTQDTAHRLATQRLNQMSMLFAIWFFRISRGQCKNRPQI